MPLDEILAKAIAAIDEIVAERICEHGRWMVRAGWADDDIAAELANMERACVEVRDQALAGLRAWLERDGEALH